MPRLSKEFKSAVEQIPQAELMKLVLELAKKNKENYDYIELKYLSSNDSEQELFERTRDEVYGEMSSVRYGRVVQKSIAAAMTRAVRHINYFEKVTKNNVLVAELLLFLLEDVFDDFNDELGTCWTVFDSKLAVTTNRLYNLVTKKLHPDFLVEYRKPLNRFLGTLKQTCNHLDYVYNMPEALPE